MKKHLIINEDSLAIAISNIKNYAKKKEPFNVLIQPILEKRTSRQLRYYWVLISIIQDWLNEQGNQLTQDQTSDLMKAKFYNEIIMLPNGEKRKVLKSISDKSETNIKEMAEYITKITVECAEWGIDIPFCDNDYNF
jgi:hypothetical protein